MTVLVGTRLERSLCSDGTPVSCMDFNLDGVKLAVGYATGLVRVINIMTGRMIENTNEVVQPGRGIIHITFMGSGRRLMIVDSGGSVYEMRTHTRVRVRRVKCVFSGCHGEVVYVKTLANDSFLAMVSLTKLFLISLPDAQLIFANSFNGPPDRPPLIDWQFVDFKVVYVKTLANDSFLAMVSLTKLFLISLPDAQLIFANSFNGPPDRPPLIDWQFVDFKMNANEKLQNAVLAAGRGSRIDLFRLFGKIPGAKNIAVVKSFSLEFEMINLKWVDPFHLLALDSEERIHLIDISKGEIAQRDLSTVELVYGSADFKGLSTGGNVSSAMEYLSNAVCYQSVYRVGGEVCILGRSSVCVISVVDQIAQLQNFIERDDILSAVLYSMDIFTGKVVNKSRRVDLRYAISGYLPTLIDRLLSLTTSGLHNGKITHLVDHYRKHISLLLHTCVTTSRFDLLYNTIYPRLEKDPLSKTIFFEFLDEVVLDGLLDNPPPSLEMFENVATFVDREVFSDCEIAHGNKLLLYLQCCLAGRAYPFGSLPDGLERTLPLQVYRCVVSDYLQNLVAEGNFNQFESAVVRIPIDKQDIHYVMTTCRANRLYDGIIYVYNKALQDYLSPLEEMFENVATFVDREVFSDCEIAHGNKLLLYLQCCLAGRAYPFGSLPDGLERTLPLQVYRCVVSLKGKDGNAAQTTFPYLRLLLKLDAQQFFNVICTCSDLPLFVVGEGRLQRLVEVTHQLAVSMPTNVALLSHLLTFVTHLLQKGALMPALDMIAELIDKVLSGDASELRIADTDRCIVELMRNVSGLNETLILRRAERLPHLQVCAYIYTNRREFDKLVECYLRDNLNAVCFILISSLIVCSMFCKFPNMNYFYYLDNAKY
uniref:Vps8 domain-containing protein n=1 Tax=Ascaris lumbricoides TaxID=6252 RepID=A0A0M3IMQ5_ASCLU